MMYVQNDDDIRDFIRFGSAGRDDHDDGGSHDHKHDDEQIRMPAYDTKLNKRELDDLVAAFKVLARMSLPPTGSPARGGYELARDLDCFSCHGPGASGGLPNPRSFTGFIPGWYGSDFHELVRSREEFDQWIVSGRLTRLERHPVAGRFQRRQLVQMPAYADLSKEELNRLWAYALWLQDTGGGYTGVSSQR